MDEPGRTHPSVLLITRNLPPLRGGMERLVQHVARSLANDCDLSVVGPEGCAAYLPQQTQTREVAYRPLSRFLIATACTVWKATRRNFGYVIAGSGLTAPLAWWAARRAHARFVVYLHGLDIIAPSAVYQHCWLPFIRRADLVLVNSDNTRRLAIERGVPQRAIEILHPGTELPKPDPEAGQEFRAAHGLGDRPLLLSVGRLTPRKGLAEFICQALPEILARNPDALLLVIGADANDAVRPAAGSEYARILSSAEKAGVSAAVRMLPPCDDAMLSAAYCAANAYIFPVLDLPGDVEGFGMVAIEAAAHGLPTIGFRVGGVPDAIVDGTSGSLIEPKDYAGFATQVDYWLTRGGQSQVQAQCLATATAFGWDRFGERLRALLRSIPLETTVSRPGYPAGTGERARRGHAVLDLASRDLKAIKIARLIGAHAGQPSRRMLEIGTGSGGIAHYFGTSGAMIWDVDAIDVEDVRLVSDGFRFTKVNGVVLPFADGSFDVVVSNHVIEHVGDDVQQMRHLQELARVMRPGGIGYLAVPNRWMLVEPHYKLLFLSWLPQSFADAYVRLAGKGGYYDCRPLTTCGLESKLRNAGLAFVQRHGEALRLTYELERPEARIYRWLLKPIPDAVYAVFRRAFPTLIYTFKPTLKPR